MVEKVGDVGNYIRSTSVERGLGSSYTVIRITSGGKQNIDRESNAVGGIRKLWEGFILF